MEASSWLELLARSTALLLSGELVLLLLRGRGAAHRHRVILFAGGLLALLPVLSVMLPEISLLPKLQSHSVRAGVTAVEIARQSSATIPAHFFPWYTAIWGAGVLVIVLRLAIGTVLVHRLVRRAQPFRDEVFVSRDVGVPLTCGILRPRILLPWEARSWSEARIAAVLAHERAHIRRGDVLSQTALHVLAAFWWFQPLIWVARWRLRLESELAADADAIRSGLRPSDYASELIAIARSAAGARRLPPTALAMVRIGGVRRLGASHLEKRVRATLAASGMPVRWPVFAAAALLLATAAVAASAISFRPRESSNTGGSTMKRTLLSALLTSAGLSAATISGTVHDATGAAVPGAKVTLIAADSGATQNANTDTDGRFALSGNGAGQYILRIEKPDFASVMREFDMTAESDLEHVYTMPPAGSPPAVDIALAKTPAGEPPRQVRIGGGVAQGNLLSKVQPVYPAAAKANHVQGSVVLEMVISKDGVPSEIQVKSSPSDDLSASALNAVRQWRYKPTLLDGNPIEVITTVLCNYSLSE
jgi:TonB family protein